MDKLHAVDFPLAVDVYEELQSLDNGSSKPKKVQINQQLFVLKRGANDEQIAGEVNVNSAYRAAGILAPASRLYETPEGKQMLGQWIRGATWREYQEHHTFAECQLVRKKMQAGFVLDCLFGNWDVIGLNEDNIVVDEAGDPWRVDNGGALSFRAKGEKKTPSQWNENISEFFTMQHQNELTCTQPTWSSNLTPQAKIFYDLTQPEVLEQLENALAKSKEILACIAPDELPVLQLRFNSLLVYRDECAHNLRPQTREVESFTLDAALVSALQDMGFSQNVAVKALTQSKNNLNRAMDLISNGEILDEEPPQLPSQQATQPDIPANLIAQITEMGFDEQTAKGALEASGNSVERALELLMGF